MNLSLELFGWTGLLVCLALSFILSGMEAGVFTLSRLRIRQQTRMGRRSARLLQNYLEYPEDFLWTILVGNTIANFIILWAVTVELYHALRGHAVLLALLYAVFVFFFYTFFDLLPKMLFRKYPNRLCLMMAPPFRILHLLLRPLVWLVEGVSALLLRWRGGHVFTGHLFGNREELRFVMQESAQAFTSEERAMINRILDLPSMTVRLITRPLDTTIMVNMSMSVSEVLALARQQAATRLPVWEQRADGRRVVGLILLDALLFHASLDPAKPVAGFVRPALYLDEGTRLEAALRRMQRSGQRLAVVLDRGQREIGVVSLHDILKTLFGELSL